MKKTLFFSLAVVFAFSVVSVGVSAKQENAGSKKSSVTKEEKIKEFRNFQKPAAGQTNAQVYREKIEKTTGNLKKISTEFSVGEEKVQTTQEISQTEPVVETSNEEIVQDVVEIAEEVDQTADETAEAIEEVEGEGKLKKLILGSDYKNLGQLRSSLVHSRNQIRKLTKLSEEATGETQTAINEQLTYLMQERERIQTIIDENEGGFSLFGWLSRFLSGYSKEDEVSEDEEAQLEEDVAEIITEEPAGTDGTATGETTEPSDGAANEEPASETETPAETPAETPIDTTVPAETPTNN